MESQIILTKGKKNGTDLAQWFGVSSTTFRNHKKDYLEKLKKYADFEVNDSGKVIIKEIYEPYYDTEKTVEKFTTLVPLYWNKNGMDSAARVGREIYWDEREKDPDGKIAQLKESTAINYACKGRSANWGSPLDPETGGPNGYCYFAWGKMGPDGKFERPLTPEEEKTKDGLYQMYYGNVNDRDVFLMDLRDRNLIDDEQLGKLFREYYKKKISFVEFKKILSQTLGFPVEKGTISVPMQSFEEAFIPNWSTKELPSASEVCKRIDACIE